MSILGYYIHNSRDTLFTPLVPKFNKRPLVCKDFSSS